MDKGLQMKKHFEDFEFESLDFQSSTCRKTVELFEVQSVIRDIIDYYEKGIVVEFEGKALEGTFYKGRSTIVQSTNKDNDDSYVEFILDDTYGNLQVGKKYKIIIKEVE